MIRLPNFEQEYMPSFRILMDDFEEHLTHVEPVDANLTAYSHRSYSLFLRACTEFESLSKQCLIVLGSSMKPSDMNVTDYRSLESTLEPVMDLT